MSLQKNGQDLKQINNAKNDLLKKKLAVRSIRFVKSSQILSKLHKFSFRRRFERSKSV